MATHGKGPDLYVVIEAGETAVARLSAALAAATVASVLIRPAPGKTLDARAARPLVELAQSKGAAALVADNAMLSRALQADGVHLDGAALESDALEEAFRDAREIVGGRAIVGVRTGRLRHDAMVMAEAGADYIGFGLTEGDDGQSEGETRADLVDWWSEIFEIPVVAFDAATAADAAELARIGADFVAITLPTGDTPAATATHVANWARAIAGGPVGVEG